MAKKINEKSSVRVIWKDKFENYSKQKEKEIINHIKAKYKATNVRVEFTATNKLQLGVANLETGDVENINTPEVQEKIMLTWLKENNIDITLEDIKRLNVKVEASLLDFNETKDNKWKINNLTIENFLSYKDETTFNFSDLKGLTLIQGRNFSGKTTILEALIFLLFNKTTKTSTADEIINRHTNADFARVQGELVIDNVEYLIIREVIRTWKKDKSSYKTSTALKFMTKNELGVYEEPDKEEDRKATDKKIKENIGSYNEFLMTVVCTGDNIFDIIKAKATERGALLSKFLGLEIFEKKEEVVKKMYGDWKLKSNIDKYSSATLQGEISDTLIEIETNVKNIETLSSEIKLILQEKSVLVVEKEELLGYYHNDIDTNMSNVNEDFYLNRIEKIKLEILEKKGMLLKVTNDYIKDLPEFDVETHGHYLEIKEGHKKTIKTFESDIRILEIEIKEIQQEQITAKNNLDKTIRNIENNIMSIEGDNKVINSRLDELRTTIKLLKTGAVCPECGQKVSEVDHSQKIALRIAEGVQKKNESDTNLLEIEKLKEKIIFEKENFTQVDISDKVSIKESEILLVQNKIKDLNTDIEDLDKKITELLLVKDKVTANDMLELRKDKYEVEIESLDAKQIKEEDLLKKYRHDIIKIEKNKELDIKIRNKNIEITEVENRERNKSREVITLESDNNNLNKGIDSKKVIIDSIKKEEHIAKVFNTYIHMVGKNGITKTIVKNSIPVLNLELDKLLRDSAEFTVEIEINTKNNEVEFWLVDNESGLKAPMISGSGYEKTIGSLAIRIVNSKVNSLPKPSLLLIDEIFGTVDTENLELIKLFLDKIAGTIDNVFMITHNDLIKEWADHIVTVTKIDKISTVTF